MTIGAAPICMWCKHFDRDNETALVCKAFPKGIPEAIYLSAHDHHLPYPGDNGILYEPLEATDATEKGPQ